MTEKDRRILNFLLSHGLISVERLQDELRLQIELEAARCAGNAARKHNAPEQWSLHRELHFPQHLSDAAFLLTAGN